MHDLVKKHKVDLMAALTAISGSIIIYLVLKLI